MKQRYWVELSRILIHDGERYEGGQAVALEEAAAQPLLELGAILEHDPLGSDAESETVTNELEPVPAGAGASSTRRRGRPRR